MRFLLFGLLVASLVWTLLISLLTGIIFGIAPAMEATRLNLNDALKEGGKGAEGQGTRSRRLRSVLVIAEVALALVLLVSAGLLIRSFSRLRHRRSFRGSWTRSSSSLAPTISRIVSALRKMVAV